MFRIAASIAGILAMTSMAADWPVFRGNPTQTGVASDVLPEILAIRWQFRTSGDENSAVIESTAAIAGGVAFVGAFDDHLYAIDLATGKEKWKAKIGAIKAPVGVHGSAVFAGNVDSTFHCLDAATGKPKWQFDVGTEVSSGMNFTDDSVLFGSLDETLHCLSIADGKRRWKYQVAGGPVMGTPAVANGKTFAAGCDSTLHIIDIGTGKEIAGVNLGGQVGASAAVKGDLLVVGTMTNDVVAVNLAKRDIAWTFTSPKRPQPFFASAALGEKLAIVGSRDKRVYALKQANGEEAWSFATDAKVDSSPVIAGSRVYFGSHDGNFYVLEAQTGKQVQKIKLDGPISASPAIANGCLVIGTERGTVYCLGAAK